MNATYETDLSNDLSWVRFLIGDTDTSQALLTDEEVVGLIAAATSNGLSGGESSAVYFAAARALRALATKWQGKSQGVLEKQVSRLRIRYGGSGGPADAVVSRAEEYERRAAYLLRPQPKYLWAL